MAPAEKKGPEKKWGDAAERDLLMAMLCVNSAGTSIKTNWVTVANAMNQMGYNFSESAISQKFQKSMIKDFRKQHGQDCVVRFSSGPTAKPGDITTPSKATTATAAGSASASKRKRTNAFTPVNTPSKVCKGVVPASDEDCDDFPWIKDDMVVDTPSKKVKIESDTNLTSPSEHRNDEPIGFDQWMKECEA